MKRAALHILAAGPQSRPPWLGDAIKPEDFVKVFILAGQSNTAGPGPLKGFNSKYLPFFQRELDNELNP